MTKKKSFEFKLSSKEIICIVFFGIFFLIIPAIVFFNNVDLLWLKEPTQVGTNIAGLLVPFLSFMGSILVYMAFKSQIEANKAIQNQFHQQSEEQIFFRLMDSLDKRIISYSIIDNNTIEKRGYNALEYFVSRILKRNMGSWVHFGKDILIYEPELLTLEDFTNINKYINPPNSRNFTFHKLLLDIETVEERKIFVDSNIDVSKFSNLNLSTVLVQIAKKNYYSSPIECHVNLFNRNFDVLFLEYAGFFDGYFKTLKSILIHIEKSDNKDFYINYISQSITNYEKFFILNYIGSRKSNKIFNNLTHKFELLDDLTYSSDLMFLKSSEEEYSNFLQNILIKT